MGKRNRTPSQSQSQKDESARRSPFRLLSVRIAIVLTVLGAGMWVYALATAPTEVSPSQSGDSGLASGMAPRNATLSGAGSTQPRAIDSAAPAVLRFGAAFLGAFMVGYFLRKFVRWTILVVAVIALLIFLLHRSGMVDLPWDQIEDQVQSGSSWLQAQADSVKGLLTGYLPSSVAAVLGGFIGFWRG